MPAALLAEWAFLLGGTGLLTISENYGNTSIAGLALLGLFFGLRAVRGALWPRGTGLEIPLGLFLVSGAVAVWVAYDQSQALLQFGRILAAVGLFIAISDIDEQVQRWLAWGFVAAAALLTVYWPLQHDFSAGAVKFSALTRLGMALQAALPAVSLEMLTGPDIHSNVAGGALVTAIPFGAALAWMAFRSRRLVLALFWCMTTLVIVAGLALTQSRGAWLGLAAVTGLFFLAVVQVRWFASARQKMAFWGVIIGVGVAGIAALTMSGGLERLLGSVPGGIGSSQTRLQLWKQASWLVGETFWTGSGLRSFWMVYPTYSLLIHAPILAHAHNVLLEVWLEQGVFGAVALVWGAVVVIGWVWRALDVRQVPALGWAGLAALVAAAVHGMLDVVFYFERTLPLVGFLLGFAWLVGRSAPRPADASQLAWRRAAIGIAATAGLAAAVFYQPLLASVFSNLGAVQQSQQELRIYGLGPFDNPTLDEVRRGVDLTQSEGYFSQALTWQPVNRPALVRLSQIALSRGAYDQALAWMETAWQAGYRDEVVRLLYSDALAANGQPEQAAQVVAGIERAEGRMMFQAFYRYHRIGDAQREADTWQTVALFNPANLQAQNALKELKSPQP